MVHKLISYYLGEQRNSIWSHSATYSIWPFKRRQASSSSDLECFFSKIFSLRSGLLLRDLGDWCGDKKLSSHGSRSIIAFVLLRITPVIKEY